MNTKKEQAFQNIMNDFQEMADRVLEQITLIEKLIEHARAPDTALRAQ